MSLRRWAAAGALLLTAVAAGCGSPEGPTVRPEDIRLTATITPVSGLACDPRARWVLAVQLDRARPVPLQTGETVNQYLSEVQVFDGERPLSVSDFGQFCTRESVEFDNKEITLGNDGRTYSLAVKAAHQSRDLPADWPATRSNGSGFTYIGERFPITVRYYLRSDQPPPKIAVIYAHYEKRRLGRDVSWTKTTYAKVAK